MKKIIRLIIIIAIILLGFSINIIQNQYKTIMDFDNLRNWNYNKDILLLQGKWEYYPNQIIFPGEFYTSKGQAEEVTLPFDIPKNVKYATFKLVMDIPYYSNLGLIVNETNSNMNLYLNDTYILKDNNYPYYLQIVPSSKLELVIHINNSSRLTGNIALGSYDKIYFAYESYIRTQLGVFILAFVLGLYFMFLYLLTGRDKNILLYSSFTLLISIIVLFLGNSYIHHVTQLPVKSFKQLTLTVYGIGVVNYFVFIKNVLKDKIKFNKIFYKGSSIFIGISCLSLLIIHEDYYFITDYCLQVALYSIGIYIYFKTFKLLFHGSIEERILIISFYVLLVSSVAYLAKPFILFNLHIVLFGICLSILIQSLYFAMALYKKVQYANTIAEENKKMLQEVQQFNQILDKKINERTKELEELVKKDPLTDLYNHLHIFTIIEDVIKNNDSNKEIHIFISDLDNFKQINDLHGHLAGDSVIIRVSEIMTKYKEKIIFGRSGGEEFLGITIGMATEEVYQLAERIRLELQSIIFEDLDSNIFKVTLSGGISKYNGQTVEEIIKEADDNLYKAKRLGKNRVCY